MMENVDLIGMVILSALFTALSYNWSATANEIFVNFLIILSIVGIILAYLFMHFKQKYDQEHENQLNELRQQIEQNMEKKIEQKILHQTETQQKQLDSLKRDILEQTFEQILNKQDRQTEVITDITSIVKYHDESINSTINKLLADYGESLQNHDQRINKLLTDQNESNKINEKLINKFRDNHYESISNHDKLIQMLRSDFSESSEKHQKLIKNLESDYNGKHKIQEKKIRKLETDYNTKRQIQDERIIKLETDYKGKHKINDDQISNLETECNSKHKIHEKQIKKLKFANNTERNQFSDYNILLLGEIDVGKSTTINAFANYMKYDKLEDALERNFVELIPSKFTIPESSTGKSVNIESGKDSNEMEGSDSSKTKKPQSYKLNYGDKVIHLIDTPGIGDSNDIRQDRKNLRQIFNMSRLYKNLHGIIILIKSTENSQTTFFRYWLTELLTQLPKCARENIMFCFTFSKNSSYGPGAGFANTEYFLKTELKNKLLDLEVNQNCFFIDNEAYRFLVADKLGVNFPDNLENLHSYRDSWDNSKAQFEQMLANIMGHRPHDLQSTTSLLSCRELMYKLKDCNYIGNNSIMNMRLKLADYIVEHSIMPYNNFVVPHLNIMIDEEEYKIGVCEDYPNKKLTLLKLKLKLKLLVGLKEARLKEIGRLKYIMEYHFPASTSIKDIFDCKNDIINDSYVSSKLKAVLVKYFNDEKQKIYFS